ncbi:MAG: hypothetical protein QXK76_02320 [Candidatus Woesearchaeota archaeon]
MMKKRGIGQSWSLDIILAIVIFMLIIGIFYALLNNNKKSNIYDIQIEANIIANSLDSGSGTQSDLTIINNGIIDNTKLEELYGKSYDEIKKKFGLKGDFCIYIVDQYGNIISVNSGGKLKNAFGSQDLKINDLPCGSIIQ